jgi:HNH endonuclease
MDPVKFWLKINKHGPIVRKGLGRCWIWKGGTDGKGYGRFRTKKDGGKNRTTAHRYAYELKHGKQGSEVKILHKCDNPPCVRDSHLYAGTIADNNRDRVERGRSFRGEDSPNAKVTESQVKWIRDKLLQGSWVSEIAGGLGVSYQLVYNIANGATWKHLGPIEYKHRHKI